MFACFFEQVVRFINTFSFHSLFQITISKPKLGIDLLSNLSAFIRNPVPSLMQLFNRFSVFFLIK